MKKRKINLWIWLLPILLSTACAGGGNAVDSSELYFRYPHKTNVVADRQSYEDGKIFFDDALWQTPAAKPAAGYENLPKTISAYFIDGPDYRGRKTKVFVYVGFPEGADEGHPVPGVVLVHGGGGTAFWQWVRLWNERGYAAIAMDTEGRVPTATAAPDTLDVSRPSPEYGGPENAHLQDGNLPVPEQWTYQAAGAVIAAHSFLRSFPAVDAARIGVTGISYGGYLCCVVTGYDDRLAFSVPVYGCLSLAGTAGDFGDLYRLCPQSAEIWDGTSALAHARTPILFINGNVDVYFPPQATSRSAAAAKYGSPLIVDGLAHGHVPGYGRPEIAAFADALCREGPILPRVKSQTDGQAEFDLAPECALAEAELFWTEAETLDENARWQRTAARIAGGHVAAEVPRGAQWYYLQVKDSHGFLATSEVRQK